MEPVGLPTLVSTTQHHPLEGEEGGSEQAIFSPVRSSRRAQFVNDVGTTEPPQRAAGRASQSPAPHAVEANSVTSVYTTTSDGPPRLRANYTRHRSSVSANSVVELPLGNAEVESVVARRLSTNPALPASSGHRRSLSWFAGAPRANTVEEDLQEEILEEKQERKTQQDVSPLEQFNAELMKYFEENSQLQKRRDANGTAQLEDQEMVQRRQRDAQLAHIEQRRAMDKRKFDLVDDMYERALQRRYRAMQKIAADPPADRLIGHNMMQYIPASMLPGYAPDHVAEHARTHTSGGTAAGAASQAPLPAQAGPNPIVFLTELDGIRSGASGADATGQATGTTTRTGSPGDAHKSATATQSGRRTAPTAAAAPGLRAPEALVEQWRELGYEVTYVDGHGRAQPRELAAAASSSSGRRAPQGTSAQTNAAAGSLRPDSGGAYDAQRWMKLAPLPSVCLVQKRLAPETSQKATRTPQSEEDGARSTKGGGSTGSVRQKTKTTSQWSFGASASQATT